MTIGKLDTVVLDVADLAAVSAFYQALVGWKEAWVDDDWITLETADGWRIGLQSAPDHQPPVWPGQERPQQAHLDIRVPDLEAASAQAVALGGVLLRRNDTWHTVADPAGHPFDLCAAADNPTPTLMGVMLDCPDAAVLSAFYAELLGKPVTYEAPGMAMIGEEGAHPVMFQQVEGYAAPRWPDPAYPQQFHLDVHVEDLDAGERAAVAIGATRLAAGTDTFRVFTDPAGKPFCLTIPN